MKFLDLFAGIGGFRMGLESLGHECVGFCEIDKFARKSYKAIYNTEGEVELHDITKVTNEEWRKFRGTVDIICGGFPCQAFSIAGKRKGFLDETRGTLFFEIARAAKEIKPPLLFLENVKGLLSHDQGRTFRTILSTLDELGYDAEWQVLNSKNFGVPQNRERVFIIGHLREAGGRPVFPIRGENEKSSADKQIKIVGNIRKNGKSQSGQIVSNDSLAPTLCASGLQKDPLKVAIPVLTPDRANKRQNGRRFKTDGEPMFTLTGQDRHGIVVVGNLAGSHEQNGRIYDVGGISPTLNTMQGGDRQPKIRVREATKQGFAEASVGDSVNLAHPNSKTRRGRVGKGVANTLLTGEEQGVVVSGIYTGTSEKFKRPHLKNTSRTLKANNHDAGIVLEGDEIRIRKLTPRECWRLQGFPDWAFDKAQEINSNSQLYKQAGNSVTVNVIKAIAERLEE